MRIIHKNLKALSAERENGFCEKKYRKNRKRMAKILRRIRKEEKYKQDLFLRAMAGQLKSGGGKYEE